LVKAERIKKHSYTEERNTKRRKLKIGEKDREYRGYRMRRRKRRWIGV
jgi:hypothetical protein